MRCTCVRLCECHHYAEPRAHRDYHDDSQEVAEFTEALGVVFATFQDQRESPWYDQWWMAAPDDDERPPSPPPPPPPPPYRPPVTLAASAPGRSQIALLPRQRFGAR